MSVTRPRGPLPARVYWTRRLLVLGLAVGLVFGISRILGTGADESPNPTARAVSVAGSTAASPSAVSTADAQTVEQPKPTGKKVRPPLPMPTGPCRDEDVRVEPSLQEKAYAGGNVRLTLRLTTFTSPACNWEVSGETVVVKLTSGSDRIWSSQECPDAVPTQAVVLRQRKAAFVDVTWPGRRSDSDCSRTTLWAEPGYYHLSTAALGSEPESQQFRLLPPAPVTITPTPTPEPKRKASARPSEEAADR